MLPRAWLKAAEVKSVFSVIALLTTLSLAACAPFEPKLMEIKPGVEGTFVAVSAPAEIQLEAEGEQTGKVVQFKVGQSDTAGISIGTAIGDEKEQSKNERMLFIPASVTKVVTAALALKSLGKDYRFTTELRWTPGSSPGVIRDLSIYADGDPQVGRENEKEGPTRARIREIVHQLKARGITKIEGNLRLISSDVRKDSGAPYDGYQKEDFINCYGAIAQAFNYRRNCASFVVKDIDKGQWNDLGVRFPFTMNLVLGSTRDVFPTPSFASNGVVSYYSIDGTWSVPGKDEWFGLPVPEVKSWYGNALISELTKQGIDISSLQTLLPESKENLEVSIGESEKIEVFKIHSDPMTELTKYMNKPSDNFIADALFKALALRDGELDIRKSSYRSVRAGLIEFFKRAGKPEYINEVEFLDGAGLTRNNRTSPRAFLTLLKEFSKEQEFEFLWDSLAVAGRDGTLKSRMTGTVAAGKVRAKTGTLRGAYQLAGYVPRYASDGSIKEYVPFVILSATTPENRTKVQNFQDQLVVDLMKSINKK